MKKEILKITLPSKRILRLRNNILIVFAALITPDGSGITMWFVAGLMLKNDTVRELYPGKNCNEPEQFFLVTKRSVPRVDGCLSAVGNKLRND